MSKSTHPPPAPATAPATERTRRWNWRPKLQWDWRPKLQWFLAEIIVVVVGILIALALNAWWAERQTSLKEQGVLEDIQRDFTANRHEIERIQGIIAVQAALFTRVRAMTSAEILALSPDSAGSYLYSFAGPATFEPIRGAVDALVASGDLGLIRDPALRNHLVSFLSRVEDVEEEKASILTTQRDILGSLIPLGGPYNLYAGEADPADLHRLRQDVYVMGYATILKGEAAHYGSQLGDVATVVDSVLARTAERLAE